MKTFYVGVIDKDSDSDYGIRFPDFLGCISAGSSIEEAFKMGKEALDMHIESMIEDGERIPKATSIEQLKQDPEFNDAEAFLLIPAEIPELNVKRVNITIPEYMLGRIDRFAHTHRKSRSALLVESAREYIETYA